MRESVIWRSDAQVTCLAMDSRQAGTGALMCATTLLGAQPTSKSESAYCVLLWNTSLLHVDQDTSQSSLRNTDLVMDFLAGIKGCSGNVVVTLHWRAPKVRCFYGIPL